MSRLISDSYMYRAIGAEINGACGKCSLSRSDCMCHSLSRMDVCGMIDDAPTIDAVPVVRGEWEKGIHMVECSACWEKFDFGDETWVEDYDIVTDIGWNFCPNCGAKMDGKEQEDE